MNDIPKRLPLALVILDGFGAARPNEFNAISEASTPTLDYLYEHYPHTLLQASGEAVGLLPGVMGNSEVGHLTIGAGRIIPQELTRITSAIHNGSFFTNPALTENFKKLAQTDKALHLIGLVSDAGVHSHINHLYAFLKAAKDAGIRKVYIHAFLDGRDVAPKSSHRFLHDLESFMHAEKIGSLASFAGRLYGMDRNKNWERTESAYHMLTTSKIEKPQSWHEILNRYYADGIFDEFIPPTQLNPEGIIKDGDGIVFFNFRPDRARQLAESFLNPSFDAFPTKNIQLAFFITPTDYKSASFKTTVLFEHTPIKNTLKELISSKGHRIFTCAETEKYAHLTYFFAGGTEKEFPRETRIMIPSLATKTFIDFPEMSAQKITEAVVHSLENDPNDFYLINYANADMVGHSGHLKATIQAVEFLDKQLSILLDEFVTQRNGTLIITADHGNAEEMYDEKNKQPLTCHTTNPVPFIIAQQDLFDKKEELKVSGLADIAPLITAIMK